jgi:hypothetical protein
MKTSPTVSGSIRGVYNLFAFGLFEDLEANFRIKSRYSFLKSPFANRMYLLARFFSNRPKAKTIFGFSTLQLGVGFSFTKVLSFPPAA